jgi:predicted DNA-binding transcriptional regulator AlpA
MNAINLSRSQAARRIGCCESTLRNLDKTGGGPPVVRIGPKLVRYPSDALDLWIAARTNGGTK